VLELYQVSAVTEGTDAQATVSVRLAEQGLVATGKASRPRHTRRQSARAYVHALNKLEVRRAKATGAAA
jgi:2-isopropylmalate synthase